MEKLLILIFFISLYILTNRTIYFREKKFSFNIIIGIVSLWCISFLIIQYISGKPYYNSEYFILFNIIISIIIQFKSNLLQQESIKTISKGIVWVLTFFSIVLCLLGVGIYFLPSTLPLTLLLAYNLYENKYEKIINPILKNLLIIWCVFIFISAQLF